MSDWRKLLDGPGRPDQHADLVDFTSSKEAPITGERSERTIAMMKEAEQHAHNICVMAMVQSQAQIMAAMEAFRGYVLQQKSAYKETDLKGALLDALKWAVPQILAFLPGVEVAAQAVVAGANLAAPDMRQEAPWEGKAGVAVGVIDKAQSARQVIATLDESAQDQQIDVGKMGQDLITWVTATFARLTGQIETLLQSLRAPVHEAFAAGGEPAVRRVLGERGIKAMDTGPLLHAMKRELERQIAVHKCQSHQTMDLRCAVDKRLEKLPDLIAHEMIR